MNSANATKCSLITIDDHPLFRKGLADLIETDESLALIGEAASGEEGVELAAALTPDVILLDINMKGMSGLQTLRLIKQMELDSRVLMLTVSDNEEDVIEALQQGADGYLLKDMEPEETLAKIYEVINGGLAVSDRLASLLAKALRANPEVPGSPDAAKLTSREAEVLAEIAKGSSNRKIADALYISTDTVKVHVKNILKKLAVRSRVEAAIWYMKQS